MVNFTPEQIRRLMDHPSNIRNMSVIAHVDHGKSTLSDSLLAKAGIVSAAKAGTARQLDTRQDEIDRGITIKSTAVSMYFRMKEDEIKDIKQETNGPDFLINLIDSPGHVDFSSEVTAALRVTDGALVVVDCIDGVCVQTETVLRQALGERIRPVCCINKVDRALLELQIQPEELYQNLSRVVESVNQVIATYSDPVLGECTVYPERGTVAFASGLHGWAFTLNTFARMYAAKMGAPKDKLIAKLWGDNFIDAKTKKFKKSSDDIEGERTFNKLILEPIYQIFDYCKNDKNDELNAKLEYWGVKIPSEDRAQQGKALLKVVMRNFLPAGDALLEMMVYHLPSPAVAQKYRCDTLYEGPQDDESAIGIQKCDPKGPLVFYVSKMVPTSERGRFYAFGRVFSGTVSAGPEYRIQEPDFVPGKKSFSHIKKVQRTVLMMGGKVEPLEDCPAGNICGLVGIEQFLLKSGTITSSESAHNMKVMKFSVAPIVQQSVAPKNPADLPKLIDGLQRMSKSDPCVQVIYSESGEHIVAGVGKLHLEIVLKDLEEEHACIPIIKGQPVVGYRETITEKSSEVSLAKSQNKHNRLFIEASLLGEELTKAIEDKIISDKIEPKVRAKMLVDEYDWDSSAAKKIWCFGPETTGPNLLVDSTQAVQFMNEIKDSCNSGFQWATKEGPLCDEPMRGVRFDIVDCVLHADAIHRGGGQMIPTTRRAIYGAFMFGKPSLQQPLFDVEVMVPRDAAGGVYSVLNILGGIPEGEEARTGEMVCVKGKLPVANSFNFVDELRSQTGGQAFANLSLAGWELVDGEALALDSPANKTALGIRQRKKLKPELPDTKEYYDKL